MDYCTQKQVKSLAAYRFNCFAYTVSIIFSLINPLNSAHANVKLVSAILSCQDEKCIERLIPKKQSINLDVAICKHLDGKQSTSIFKDDLGYVCRLYYYRNQSGHRGSHSCDNAIDKDYSLILDQKVTQLFYAQQLFEQIPLATRKLNALDITGTINYRTIHNTNEFAFHSKHYKNGKSTLINYYVYFCLTKAPHRRYLPYFEVLSTGLHESEMYFYFHKYDTPPFIDNPIFEKIPYDITRQTLSNIFFGDVNADGFKDIVFVEHGYKGKINVRFCLYHEKREYCNDLEIKKPLIISYDYHEETLVTKLRQLAKNHIELVILIIGKYSQREEHYSLKINGQDIEIKSS